MYNRLVSFLDKHHVLFEKQFGFRSKHRTDHAILSIVDKVQKAIEEQKHLIQSTKKTTRRVRTLWHKRNCK